MTTPETPPAGRPRFSIVSAVYNVGRYLDEFIESVEWQTFGTDRLQVVMVDDGSTDDSLARLRRWQERRPELVTIVTKENGGLPSARNAGMPSVTGEWVTFTDPDDILDRKFFTRVDDYLRRFPETQLVATRRMVFNDSDGAALVHPLDNHFVPGSDRLRNLDHDTGHFHGHAASSFFRTDLIERHELRYDERLRATFEDGHFTTHYLLLAPEPLVGYVARAEYRYRRRDDGTSQLDRSWANPGRFVDVFEHGYLDLLRAGSARYGRAPSWLQGMVIYELYWYFRTNDRPAATTAAHGETQTRFHELMAEVCALLDETGVRTYTATWMTPLWRDMLLHGYRPESWHSPHGVVDKVDFKQRLVRLTYRFTGDLPDELLYVYGSLTEPTHRKIRDVEFFDRTLVQERIVWLPFGTVRAVIDGNDLDLRTSEPGQPVHRLLAYNLEKLDPKVRSARAAQSDITLTRSERAIQRLAANPAVRAYFARSWVLLDRLFNADDSGEHLFEHLRENRPGINAWFVIEKGSADHQRLTAKHGRRVLTYGSLRWKLAMLNCEHLISSHIDEVIMKPEAILRLGTPQWRLTFLQHGVMKDDLSTWLNKKNIDVFVTSTPGEYESVVGDHTTYRYTTREVALTGLPRFDRVLAAGAKVPPDKRDFILVAPTWRNWLTTNDTDTGGAGRHNVRRDQFLRSQYAREWTSMITSPELRDLAERTGLKMAVLLHPNLQGTAALDLPPYVEILGFEGQDVQRHFARARVLITDYSSMFFNAAYIDRPIVYFQFDRDRVLGGGHLGRAGYFDYERDGFGPVTLTAPDAVDAVIKAVGNGPQPQSPYLERIQAAFPVRDGRCCERVADAILASTRSQEPKRSGPFARRLAGYARREGRRRARAAVVGIRSRAGRGR